MNLLPKPEKAGIALPQGLQAEQTFSKIATSETGRTTVNFYFGGKEKEELLSGPCDISVVA